MNTVKNSYKVSRPGEDGQQKQPFWARPASKVKFVGIDDNNEKMPPLYLSRPMPLRSAKGTKEPEPPGTPPLIHKPSNISSGSVYSNESGEERGRGATRMDILLNALGNFGNNGGEGRMSWGTGSRTSMWTLLSKSSHGGNPRLSGATSASLYSQPEESDASRRPVGVAY